MPDELTAAYRAHYLPLVRLAMQLVDDQGSAEEAVQDVFVRLARRRVDASPGYPYLRTAVVNQCRSVLRRRAVVRRTAPERAVRAWEVGDLDDVGVTGARADVAVEVTQRDQIRGAIARLPRRQREVVVLRYFEDLAVTDIASVLDISPNAASAALSRALDAIETTLRSDR